MSRFRSGGVLVVLALGLTWVLWPFPDRPDEGRGPDLEAGATGRVPTQVMDNGEVVLGEPPVLMQRARSVGASCGLEMATICVGEECASVTVVPNLSSAWGWAQLARESPEFVFSQMLQPVGLMQGCTRDAALLMASGPAVSRYAQDGREVWCVGDDLALCDRAAVDLGGDAQGFVRDQERLRHLKL